MARENAHGLVGVIVYGEDFDTLATEVGRQLERLPPNGFRVIEYEGPREYPGWKGMERNDCVDRWGTGEQWKRLQALDREYAKDIVAPRVASQVRDVAPGRRRPAVFLLHSTASTKYEGLTLQFAPARRYDERTYFFDRYLPFEWNGGTWMARRPVRDPVGTYMTTTHDWILRSGLPPHSVNVEMYWPDRSPWLYVSKALSSVTTLTEAFRQEGDASHS